MITVDESLGIDEKYWAGNSRGLASGIRIRKVREPAEGSGTKDDPQAIVVLLKTGPRRVKCRATR